MARGAPVFGRKFDCVLSLDRLDVVSCQPYRYLDGERHAVVGKHESLERLVSKFVVADRRDDECGRIGRGVLLAVDDGMPDVGECRASLRGARFRILVPREEVVRTDSGDAFEEFGERREAHGRGRALCALVVEDAGTQEFELRSMVRVCIDLPMVELDRADGLIGGKAREAFRAQAPVAAMLLVLPQPRGDRRRRHRAVGFLLEPRGSLFERVSDVVPLTIRRRLRRSTMMAAKRPRRDGQSPLRVRPKRKRPENRGRFEKFNRSDASGGDLGRLDLQ